MYVSVVICSHVQHDLVLVYILKVNMCVGGVNAAIYVQHWKIDLSVAVHLV